MFTAEQAKDAGARAASVGADQVTFMVLMNPPHVADLLFGEGMAALRSSGAVCLHPAPFASLASDEARSALAQADVLITGWGAPQLTTEVLASASRLRFILHAGGLASHVLPDGVGGREIGLGNAGWINAIPVAEFTFAMIVLANKQAFRTQRVYRERRAFVDWGGRVPERRKPGQDDRHRRRIADRSHRDGAARRHRGLGSAL